MADTHKLLTVTVPAYNAAPWLAWNLNSLCLTDLLPELDIVVIDDGSEDETGEVAEAFQRQYPETVRVFHQENGGHGAGINAGVKEAKGLFFKVVDADDWVEAEAFRALVDCLREAKEAAASLPDIISSGFLWATENGSGDPESFPVKAEIERPFPGVRYHYLYRFEEIADRLYLKMHNLTYRTELLREHWREIDRHCYYVDTEYITYPIPGVETILFLPDFVYRYRIGGSAQSVSPKKMLENARQYDRVIRSLLAFYESDTVQKECLSGAAGRRYIAGIIARACAARIRLFLSLPVSAQARDALVRFDRKLAEAYPDVYKANKNKTVTALRASGYRLYKPAALAVHKKYCKD